MLSALILNGDATLNAFQVVGSVAFYPGEEITTIFRLIDVAKDLRYIPPIDTIITFKFSKTDQNHRRIHEECLREQLTNLS